MDTQIPYKKVKESPATLADHCDEAAGRLKQAASALRHGRLATAREQIAAATILVNHVERAHV
jgi:hypothetical protein